MAKTRKRQRVEQRIDADAKRGFIKRKKFGNLDLLLLGNPKDFAVGPSAFPSDLSVKLKNVTIMTHKLILVSSGEVFQTILEGDSDCSELDCSVDIGKLNGVDITEDTWTAFLKCLYPTMVYKPEDEITARNFAGVAALAKKYHVPTLTQFCDRVGLNEVISQMSYN